MLSGGKPSPGAVVTMASPPQSALVTLIVSGEPHHLPTGEGEGSSGGKLSKRR